MGSTVSLGRKVERFDEKANPSWPLRTELGFPASRFCVGGRVAIVAFVNRPDGDQIVLSLKSICIPSSIETISDHCFCDCRNLSILTFESGCKVLILGESAFRNCSSLQSICIPSSVETISSDCFENCRNLSILTFESCCKFSNLG
jgi:hypothetical protein